MKKLIETELTFSKSTKGTNVLSNEDAGMSIYVPKPFFAAAGIKPEGKYRLLIEAIEEN